MKKCDTEIKISFGKVENIMGKEENTVYQDLLLILHCFQKLSLPGLLKLKDGS